MGGCLGKQSIINPRMNRANRGENNSNLNTRDKNNSLELGNYWHKTNNKEMEDISKNPNILNVVKNLGI